jgi:hypothetical protein
LDNVISGQEISECGPEVMRIDMRELGDRARVLPAVIGSSSDDFAPQNCPLLGEHPKDRFPPSANVAGLLSKARTPLGFDLGPIDVVILSCSDGRLKMRVKIVVGGPAVRRFEGIHRSSLGAV